MHSRRALLYVPGDDRHKSEKAASLDVDCICMDMEDGTAATRKAQARPTIARALQEVDFGASEKLARINSVLQNNVVFLDVEGMPDRDEY